MAYGLDASDILSSYMQGANFVQQGMDRARKRDEEEKQQAANEWGSGLTELLISVDPKTGQRRFRNQNEVFQSEEFKNLINNTRLGREMLSEGMPEGYTPKLKGFHIDDQDQSVIPIVQWTDKDGNTSEGPVSVDPETGQRSNGPNSVVVRHTFPGLIYKGLSTLHKYDPTQAKAVSENFKNAAVETSLSQLHQLPPDQREPVIKQLMDLGVSPEKIHHVMQLDTRFEPVVGTGMVKVTDPNGSSRMLPDAEAKALDLQIQEYKREQNIKDQNARNAAELDFKSKNSGLINAIDATATRSRIAATAEGNRDVAPIVAETSRTLDQAKYDQTREQNAKMNRDLRDAWTVLTNPASTADQIAAAQSKADEYQKDPVVGETARKTFSAMRSLEPKSFGGLLAANPKAAAQAIIDGAPYRTAKELDGLYADVRSRAENGDANAREVLPTLIRAMDGPNADKGKGAEPGKFQSGLAKEYYKSVSGNKSSDSDVQAMEAGAQQAFNRLRDALPPNEIAAGSKGETYASVAAAKAHHLAQNGMNNAEKPMYIHTELQDLGYPVDRLGSPKEFVTEIYNPLGDALKKAGVAETDDATVRRIGSELAIGLWQRGVSKGVAVNEVAKLFKDPRTYANKLRAAGGDLRSLAEGLAKEIEGRPSALGQAIDKAGPVIDSMSME